MTCDSGGLTGVIEMRPQEALAAVADLDVLRRQLHLNAERTVPSHGVTLLGAVVPRHVPPQFGAVVLLRGRADVGSGEETRGAETVRSLRKDALGRPCNCNASQQVPTRLLRLASGLHGPVECAGLLLHLDRGHGITASLRDVLGELPRELHYVAADLALGDGRPLLALQTAPVSTRVLSKWPKDTSPEDLSYLREMPMRLLHLASGPYVPVECGRLLLHLERGHGITASLLDPTGELTKELHYVAGDCTLGDGRSLLALQVAPVSTRVHIKRPMETSVEDLLCYLHFGDLNMIETRGENVNEIYAIESTTPICFLIHTPGTQEQRTVWLLLNNNTRIFQGDTSGTMHMEAFQNMCFNFNSTQIIPCDSSSLQKYQAMNKESGHWLLKDESDAFNTSYVCYIGPDASAGVVSCNFATHVAKIKRQCVVKQGSLLDTWDQLSQEPCYMVADYTLGDVRLLFSLKIAPVMSTRVPIKWPMDTLVEDLLTYLHDPMAASFLADKTIATGKVYYGDVSTKYSSTHYPSETVALLCKIQLSHRVVVTSWRKHNLGWRSLSRLLKIAKVGDLNMTETRGDDVNEIYAIESTTPICFLFHTPGTQEQRTMWVWLLLNNNTRIFQGNTSGTLHMEAFQNMCFNFNSTQIIPCDSSSLQKYQATNKESGHWLLKDEWDFFNSSYVWFPKKWPMDISLEDLLSYLLDAKAASLLEDKTTVSGEVDCGKAMKGCVASFPMQLLMVDEKTSIYSSILNVALSTKDASTHDRSERREALLFGCRTLPPLLNAAKVGDATKSDSVLVSIFVRLVSGKSLVLTVNLDKSSQHMMCLYAQKTNTKLELQYFIYGKKRLEPDSTLLSYGVKADSTIHVCTWLLGGAVTISNYLTDNQEKFLIEVTLPNGKVSLEMTKIGCLFLSTWLKCFTRAFANSKSWNGNFTRDDFKVVHGHVMVITGADANVRLDSSSMKADMARLVQYITAIFKKNKSNLISKFPPYMENLITFLGSMGSPSLYNTDRLFIETHVCCVESAARGVLLVMVQRKFKSLSSSDQMHWKNTMKIINPEKTYVSADGLSGVPVFQDIITQARNRGESYGSSKPSTFRLMRDQFMHGPSHRFNKSSDPWKEKFKNDDGIELMIPAHNKDFLPEIIYCMINDEKVDIDAELLEAQVRCTCHLCHPSHSGHKGGGESSTAGKGKQPESPGSSQPSTPSSRKGSNEGAAGAPPSAWQLPQAAASSGFSQPSTLSSRQGSYGAGRPPYKQSQAAASSGFSQPSTTSSRQGSNLGSVRPPWQQSHAAASSGFSQPSTPSSRQGSYLGAGRPPWLQSHAAASSGFSQPSTPSSRQGSYLGAGRPPWLQSQAAARSGFSQPAAPRPRPPPPAPTQQQSSSSDSELGWQTATRKGKGKRYD